MQSKDEPKFLEQITALASLFSRELDDAAIALYWSAVQDLSISEFESAVREAAKTAKFFPPPSELRPKKTDPGFAAAKAWPEVMKLAQSSSGDHSDPIAKEAIRLMGGGRQLGQTPKQELETWGRKRFVELYDQIVKSTWMQDRDVRELPGVETQALTDG